MTKHLAAALLSVALLPGLRAQGQARLETGGPKPMPAAEWIDQATSHKVVRLTPLDGNNGSFYFHNNPFIKTAAGDEMVFYHTDDKGQQLRLLNLQTRQVRPLTGYYKRISGEIVGRRSHNVYYQVENQVYVVNADTRKERKVYTFPADFPGSISSLNADETLLAGSLGGAEARDILKKYPAKSDFFNRIYDAKVQHILFTINTKTAARKEIYQENTWLGHVQFSPTDADLLMYCHEGPWGKVDRIWTISIKTQQTKLMHQRTVEGEIAGHEFFSPDGQTIWFDLQQPRSVTFYLAGAPVAGGPEKRYQHQRNEWSIHYNISPDQTLFAGDGGDPGQVAKAPDGQWINLFRPDGDHFNAEHLVSMAHHGYKLEPNVHFSPDGKWVIFRANFEGQEQVYAVEIAKSAS
ncbi:MAG: oligogalacturonate lyase family protein [Janthinobacterium lividum]